MSLHPLAGVQTVAEVGSEDVHRQVRERVKTLEPYGGVTIGPSQHLMTDIPVENTVAIHHAA